MVFNWQCCKIFQSKYTYYVKLKQAFFKPLLHIVIPSNTNDHWIRTDLDDLHGITEKCQN